MLQRSTTFRQDGQAVDTDRLNTSQRPRKTAQGIFRGAAAMGKDATQQALEDMHERLHGELEKLSLKLGGLEEKDPKSLDEKMGERFDALSSELRAHVNDRMDALTGAVLAEIRALRTK